jgi:hypothetical protein
MAPPPAQPQWTPPPQQPVGWGGPGYGGPPARPTGVTLAAIYLIVMGVLIALVGGCAAIGGAALGQLGSTTTNSGVFGAAGGILAGIGIFIVVLGILSVVAGAGALGGRGWARWTGIVISVIFAILLILGGLTSLTAQNGMTGAVGSLVVGVLYALTAYALISAGAFFSYRR